MDSANEPLSFIPKTEWYVEPPRRAAAFPVGATTIIRCDSPHLVKNSIKAWITRDFPVPAIPPRYIFNCSEWFDVA